VEKEKEGQVLMVSGRSDASCGEGMEKLVGGELGEQGLDE